MTTTLDASPAAAPAASSPTSPPRGTGPAPSGALALVTKAITALLVVGPIVALAVAVPLLWGHAVHWRDLVLAAVLYAVSGFGVTVGYHRLFTHRSFQAPGWLRVVLASAGSFAVEGSVTGWVANHRRHHVYSDRPGDPHSPHLAGSGVRNQLRGFFHAHVGWMFGSDTTSIERYAPDLLRDRGVSRVAALFPLFAVLSLALPFFLGWGLSGTIGGALTALLWAGLARMMLLHHVTWGVNSVCHLFGRQPATREDHSTNFAPMALLSFGESWHNFHHAFPSSARHGALPHQVDPSAAVIRAFERVGWATKVRWPTPAQLAACTVS